MKKISNTNGCLTSIKSMYSIKTRSNFYAKQQGAILIWAMVILLVLTLVGLSAVKTAGIGTQITGNSLFSMLVFQGAESALGKTANIHYIKMAVDNIPTRAIDVPVLDLPDENASNGTLKSAVNVAWRGYQKCPLTSIAISTTVAPKAGGVACQYYDIGAKTGLNGTGARTSHVLGVVKYAPAQHATLN
jgi:Tfp pilus assembly protein PilX